MGQEEARRPSNGWRREWLLPSSIFNLSYVFLFFPYFYYTMWLVKSMGRYVMAYIHMQQQ
jgi:hypothetical protein